MPRVGARSGRGQPTQPPTMLDLHADGRSLGSRRSPSAGPLICRVLPSILNCNSIACSCWQSCPVANPLDYRPSTGRTPRSLRSWKTDIGENGRNYVE